MRARQAGRNLPEPVTTPTRRITAGLMLLGYAVLIFGGSSGAAPDVIISLELPDYLLHVAEYAILGFLCSRCLMHMTLKTNVLVLVLLPVVFSSFYGVSDEIHQAFVPERDASVIDALADVIGSAIGALTYRWFLRSHLKKGREVAVDLAGGEQ
jgi:hypothetical protein